MQTDLFAPRIAGIDEAGRGPLAGPVTAGAVVFEPEVRFRWLKDVNDSKQVLPEMREELAERIWEKALAAAVCFVSVETIDRIGIAEASRQAMLGALGDLRVVPEHLLLDAFPLRSCRIEQTPRSRRIWAPRPISCQRCARSASLLLEPLLEEPLEPADEVA